MTKVLFESTSALGGRFPASGLIPLQCCAARGYTYSMAIELSADLSLIRITPFLWRYGNCNNQRPLPLLLQGVLSRSDFHKLETTPCLADFHVQSKGQVVTRGCISIQLCEVKFDSQNHLTI